MPENNVEEENTSLVGASYVYYVLGLTFIYYSICSIPAYYCFAKISDWDTGKHIHILNNSYFRFSNFLKYVLSGRYFLDNIFSIWKICILFDYEFNWYILRKCCDIKKS